MNNEIKEIFDKLNKIVPYANVPKELAYMTISITPQDCKLLLDCITNLQTIEQQYRAILSENAELENRLDTLKIEISGLMSKYFYEKDFCLEDTHLDKLLRIIDGDNILQGEE